MNWKHGYYADSGYTYGYYPETMPLRLHWAALVQNHEVPIQKFRYVDAGCGQGFNLIQAAIAHPDSEFVGIDFLPEHIAHARGLAERCGLTNIEFIEGDFIELAKNPQSLGLFDYAVCHGISTWISPVVKSGLFSLIGQILKPGGLFYNSYNTFPGWLGVVPFQHLVLLEQRSKTGTLALEAARKNIQVLKEHSPKMFNALPGLQARLNSLENQDPAYLVQEYNNLYWQPVFVTQMMDDMAAVKLSYLGTATIPESFNVALPTDVQGLIEQEQTLSIKEQLRDYAINQNFRRDLYVKGMKRPWTAARNEMLKGTRFMINPLMTRPANDQPFNIKGGSVEFNVDVKFYGGLLDELKSKTDGATVAELMDRQKNQQHKNSVVMAISLLLHAGYVHCSNENSEHYKHKQKEATLAIAVAASEGAPYKYAPSPVTGGAINLSDLEWVMLREHLKGTPVPQWPAIILSSLQKIGKALAKEGSKVTDSSEENNMIKSAIDKFISQKLSNWKTFV